MAKTLEKLAVELADIHKRVDPMLGNMERLDNNFWNDTAGCWNRYYAGIDMLAEHMESLGQQGGDQVGAVTDNEAKQLMAGIESAKKDCLKISKEYWTTAMRVDAIRKEVVTLQKRTEEVVKKKSKFFKKSSSLGDIKVLSKILSTFANHLATTTGAGGPHKPDHKLLK